MTINVLMPALSPTMTEGNLAKWLKKEGDPVAPGDVIAEIETDKATMEVEAVDEGRLGKILVPEGTEAVPVNKVIAILLEEGEDESALAKAQTDGAPAAAGKEGEAEAPAAPGTAEAKAAIEVSPLAKAVAEKAGIDLSTIKGTGPGGRIVKGDVEAALRAREAEGAPAAAKAEPSRPQQMQQVQRAPSASVPSDGRVFATPLARRIAKDAGIEISRLPGSGPHGRIVKADVERALREGAPAAAVEARAPLPLEAPYETVPLSNFRKVIAKRLVEAKQTIPHFYMTVECEIDNLLAARKRLNERSPEGENGYKLSVNDFVIKATAAALVRVPAANAMFTPDGLKLFKRADISVAVATEAGLITPIVRAAETKGLARISNEMRDLATRARAGKLKPEEFQGGTFSISNLGMYGIKEFAAVINPPQGAILAVGMGEQRPVVRDGEIVVRTMMSCTLSADHRVVDGAVGAEFLAEFKRLVEDPVAMLL